VLTDHEHVPSRRLFAGNGTATGAAGIPRLQVGIVHATLEVLLPDHPPLDPVVRRRVHADVTEYVVSQIQALPTFLRVPYKLAMVAFDVVPLVRYGRVLRRLDPATRSQYVTLWDLSPLAPMRNFVKLIRSCAVLAYYDHHEVWRALGGASAPSMGPSVPQRP
jgi:hypothetical protein